eukprot:2463467-Lingulodinium_polyedra.AAC.1
MVLDSRARARTRARNPEGQAGDDDGGDDDEDGVWLCSIRDHRIQPAWRPVNTDKSYSSNAKQ